MNTAAQSSPHYGSNSVSDSASQRASNSAVHADPAFPRIEGLSLQRLFTSARTHAAWWPRAVPEALLRELYALASLGPTSMNCQPMRVLWLITPQAKQRLLPALNAGNVEKTLSAPVTAIVAFDSRFHEEMPRIWHNPAAAERFAADASLAELTALRNSSLQGGYLIMAARALGLDCGPMSGFDNAKVDAEFFPDGRWRSNFLCNLGLGKGGDALKPRQPRLTFEDACQML